MTTLSHGKHEQIPRVGVTIFITNADNAAMQHIGLQYSGLLRYFYIIGFFDSCKALFFQALPAHDIDY